jgi:thiamine pyrophosphokinase
LEKCKHVVDLQEAEPCSYTVLVMGAFGGRIDQEMHNTNLLYKWGDKVGRMILFSDHALGFVLKPGKHEIVPNRDFEGPTVGLIPVGGPCEGTVTKGPRLNLNGERIEFGGLVSSCNIVTDEVVCIESKDPIFWTSELITAGAY